MKEYRIIEKLMGSVFELVIIHEDENFAQYCLESGIKEIKRLEEKLSEFRNNSVTSFINQNAGINPITVDEETFTLIKRCVQLSYLTQGAFDITVSPLKEIYNFRNKNFKLPSKEKISEALQKTGYQNILLKDNNCVFLKNKGMKISFAAIGKGYAADKVIRLWKNAGVKNGVVNASGDLTVMGKNKMNDDWRIGIPDPGDRKNILFHVPVNDASVATSGNYEQYFISNGKKYSHNINPKTGLPLANIKSATVISPSAELSDALATAISVMGEKTGLHFINQLPNTHAIIIDNKNEIYYSEKINLLQEAV